MTYPSFTVVEDILLADHVNGDAYEVSVFSETVADDGVVNIFIKTNGHVGDLLHINAHAGGLGLLEITEAASAETAGTNVTMFNYNRSSSKTSIASISAGNSWSNGTVIFDDMFGGAAQGRNSDAGDGGVNFILAGSMHYNVSMQNLSGGSAHIYIGIDLIDRSD